MIHLEACLKAGLSRPEALQRREEGGGVKLNAEKESLPLQNGAVGLISAPARDQDAVQRQLESVLADPLFANSSRYPRFLRYVVEQTLAGRAQGLKERTIGIAVFHREADYDTNVDHVVRNVAAEVRKRLLQYYEHPAHEAALRIQLPPGSYVPEFHLPAEETPAGANGPVSPQNGPREQPVVDSAGVSRPKHRALRWVVAAAGGVLIVLGALQLREAVWQPALDRFWAPVWKAPGPLVICVDGTSDVPAEHGATVNPPTLAEFERTWDLVRFSDAATLARLADMAGARRKPFRAISGRSAAYSELNGGAVVLIGSGNSEWISQVSSWLPYHLKYDGPMALVVDSRNPERTDYMVDLNVPYNQRIRDYAIVWRIFGRLGNTVTTGAAGLTRFGAAAAADFLTSPVQLEDFERRVGRGWEKKNFEVLLTVTAIKGSTWPPLIIATELWEPGSTNAFKRETAQKSGRGLSAAGAAESHK